jgi:hypothetical protein
MNMPYLIINTYLGFMYELEKKIGKVFTSKFVGTRPFSYEKRIYRAAVSQRLRNTGIQYTIPTVTDHHLKPIKLCLMKTVLQKL